MMMGFGCARTTRRTSSTSTLPVGPAETQRTGGAEPEPAGNGGEDEARVGGNELPSSPSRWCARFTPASRTRWSAAEPLSAPPSPSQVKVDEHVAGCTTKRTGGFWCASFSLSSPGGAVRSNVGLGLFFTGVALLKHGSGRYFAGTFANFLDHTNVSDGQVQGCLLPSGAGTIFHAKPVVIQGAGSLRPTTQR